MIRAISPQAASKKFPGLSLPALEGQEEDAEDERASSQDSFELNRDGYR